MSQVVEHTTPASSVGNTFEGLNIIGFANSFNGLQGTTQSDFIRGGNAGNDLDGDHGDDNIMGGNGDDSILGGLGNDVLLGFGGNDSMAGGLGNDILNGGDGADILNGGFGDDVLIGGKGNDVFEFFGGKFKEATNPNGGKDTIMDFTSGEDVIRIGDLGIGDTVSYDQTTGQLSVNGNVIAEVKGNPNLSLGNTTDTNGKIDWELF